MLSYNEFSQLKLFFIFSINKTPIWYTDMEKMTLKNYWSVKKDINTASKIFLDYLNN